MEVGVAQSGLCDAIHGRSGYDAAEGPGHDEQHVGCTLRRHNAGWPPRRRLRGLFLDHPPKFGGGGGSCLLSIVVVALGDPETPVTCWADAGTLPRTTRAAVVANAQERIFIFATSHLTILQGCRL